MQNKEFLINLIVYKKKMKIRKATRNPLMHCPRKEQGNLEK